jgi:hypothetical protein
VDPSGNFPETLDPPPPLGILAKTSSTPPLGFQPVCIYDYCKNSLLIVI